MGEVTVILDAIERGDPHGTEQLLPLVYEELRKLAAARMAQESPDQTLQATALVHESYLRLVDVEQAQHWNSRGHFFAAAAEAMRRILIEGARRRSARKRGGDCVRIPLEAIEIGNEGDAEKLLALDAALDRLEAEDSIKAELVKLRYFGGMTIDETARALGISTATANRYWAYARAWLQAEMGASTIP